MITGIDIDENSVDEAKENAKNYPWKNQVKFYNEKIQDFAQKTTEKFGVIISNTPFFENNLLS